MKVELISRRMKSALIVAAMLTPLGGTAQAQTPAARGAGKITALIPVDYVQRQKTKLTAAKDMDVLWGDVVQTEIGGRVRIRLEDSSILNVGSQSKLVIQQHDAQTQSTSLQLAYGRIRASVVRIAQPGGGFNVRTTAAVAGVVGTDESLESTDVVTTIIALGGGQVTVTPTDPRYQGQVTVLDPGEALTIIVGRPPGAKRIASDTELNQAYSETEAEETASLSPAATLPGSTLEATINGKGLAGATGVAFEREGISITIRGQISATQIPVTITVANTVPPGTYPFTVQRPTGLAHGILVVTTREATAAAAAGQAQTPEPPASQSITAIRGAKFLLDATPTRTPPGTQIVSYQWAIQGTTQSSNVATFTVNTSLLPPGNYVIKLAVINDRGFSATQQWPLTVEPGVQPAEIVRGLAQAYESLQPAQFLKYYDEQRYPNYAGFASSVESSFRTQLETVRVFQRPVNCTVVEEQDQAICQAEFQLQFTLKNQPLEFLDENGNPFPPGQPAPPTAIRTKRTLRGSENPTIRLERGDQGWKIVNYNASVSCAGGTASGVNVGSCVFALGFFSSPGFEIQNAHVDSPDLFLGGSVTGAFDVSPTGGFNGQIQYAAQGQIGNQSVTVVFTPNPSGPVGRVQFTVSAPSQVPTPFTGTDPFVLTITGTDTSGAVPFPVTATVDLVLKGDFNVAATPATTSGAPLQVTHTNTVPLAVQVVPGSGFTGTVVVDFPSLPTGFTVSPATASVAAGATGTFNLTVGSSAALGPQQITVRGTFGSLVKTTTVFVNVVFPFTLTITPATTSGTPVQTTFTSIVPVSVQVVPVLGFTGSVAIDFPGLPAGFQATGSTLAAGATGTFNVTIGSGSPLGASSVSVRGSFTAALTASGTVFVNVQFPFTLTVTPTSTSTSPLAVFQNTTLTLSVLVTATTGFTGSVLIDFPNLPTGLTVSSQTLPAGATGSFAVTITGSSTVGANQLTVRGAFGTTATATSTVFLDISERPPFLLEQFTSATAPLTIVRNTSAVTGVTVVQNAPTFTTPVTLSFGPLPAGVTVTPTTATVNPGSTQTFTFTFVPASNAISDFGPTEVTVFGSATGVPRQSATIVLNLFSGAALPFSISTGTSATSPLTPSVLPFLTGFGFNVSVSPSTLSQPVTLTVGSTPAGITIFPKTFTFTPSLSGSSFGFDADVDPSVAVAGDYQILISAVSGGSSASATLFLRLRGSFTLAVSPTTTSVTPIVLPPDGTTTTTVTVTIASKGGFAGSVTVSYFSPFSTSFVTVTPPSPQTVNVAANGTAQVTFTVGATTSATGSLTSNFSIFGNSSNGQAQNSISGPFFAIGPAGFALSPASTSVFLNINDSGSVGTATTSVFPVGGFTGSVVFTLDATSVPAGVTVSPATQTVAVGGQARYTLSAKSPATVGTFTVVANGVAGSQTVAFQIFVTLRGSITLNVTSATGGAPGTSSAPLVLAPGGSLTFNVTVGGVNGFSGSVRLQVGGIPSGVTATFASSSSSFTTIQAPGTDTLVLSASTTAPSTVLSQLTVFANDPTGQFGFSTSQSLFITVGTAAFQMGCGTSAPFSISCSTLFLNINEGSSSSLSIGANAFAGYTGQISVTASGLPAGVTMSPSTVLISPGTATTVTFRAATPATSGVFAFPFNLVGTDTIDTTRTSVVGVLVVLRGSLKLVATPASSTTNPIVVQPGGSQTVTVDVSGQNGFSGTASVSLSFNSTTGVTFSPTTTQTVVVPSSGSVQLTYTITASSTAPASGALSFFFTASSSSTYFVSNETQISGAYIVGPASFTLQSFTANLNNPLFIAPGGQGQLTVQITSVGSFSGTVLLDVVGLPSSIGVSSAPGSSATLPVTEGAGTVSFDPAITGVTAGTFTTSTTIFFRPTTAAPRGFIQATLTATSGSLVRTAPIVLFITPKLTITTTPAAPETSPVVVAPGGSATFQLAVTASPSFIGEADLSFSGAPSGVTFNPPIPRVSIGGFVNVTVNVDANVSQGQLLHISVSALVNGNFLGGADAFHIFIGSSAFQLNITPATALVQTTPLVVQPGGTSNVTVDVVALSGFSGTVTLDVSFSVSSLSTPTTQFTATPGQTVAIPVSAAAGAQGLVGRMFLSAQSGGQNSVTVAFISIGSGGFSLSPTLFGSLSSLITSTDPAIVNIGSSTTVRVLVHAQSGFTGTVQLVPSALPVGVTVNPGDAQAVAGTSQNFLVQASSSAAAGDTQFTITGTSGSLTPVSVTVFLRIRGQISLAVSPGGNSTAPLVIAPGSNQNFTISVVPVNSFAGSVLISVGGTPTGITVSPTAATATTTTPATFTLVADAAAPVGGIQSIGFSASGTFASFNTSAVLFFSVATAPTFNVGLSTSISNPLRLTINGGTSSMNVFLTPVGGFSGTVQLKVEGLPPGITATPLLTSVTIGGSGTNVGFTFRADSTVQAGASSAVTLTATSGSITVGPLAVGLVFRGDFALAASTQTTSVNPIALIPGSSTSVSISVLPLNNFTGSVDLSASASLPAGVTSTLTPSAADSQNPATLTLAVASTATASSVFGVSINGSSPLGAFGSRATTVFFVVQGPSGAPAPGGGGFSLAVPTFASTVDIGSLSLRSVFVTINSLGGFAGTITVTPVASTIPAGVKVTPASAQVAAGSSLQLQVQADPPAVAGPAQFDVQATDGVTTLTGTILLQLRGSYILTISPTNNFDQPAVAAPGGATLTYTVTVTGQNGFNGTVSINRFCFGCGNPPSGITLTGSLSASPSSPGQITVSASSTALATSIGSVFFVSSSSDSFSNPGFSFFSVVGPPSFRPFNSTSPAFPRAVMINGGGSSVQVCALPVGGFAGTIEFAVGALPAGLVASPQSGQVFVSGSGGCENFVFKADNRLTQGPLDITASVTHAGVTQNTFVYLFIVSNLALVQTPATNSTAPLRLIPGDTTGQTVTVQVLNEGGFTGSVPLAVSSFSTGLTVTPSSTTVAANGSAAFQVTADATATIGLKSVTIQSSFAGLFAQTTIFFFVGAGSFTLTTTPASSSTNPIMLNPDGTSFISIGITVNPVNGFTGTVTISIGTLPAGVTGSCPSGGDVLAGQTINCTFVATTSQGATPVQVTFNGTSTIPATPTPITVTASTSSFLLVNAPQFSISAGAASIAIEQGVPTPFPFDVVVTGSTGFTGTVTIQFFNVPQGVVFSPSSAQVVPTTTGVAVPFTVVANSTAVVGGYAVVVSGTSGSLTATVLKGISVVAPTSGVFITTDPPTSATAPVLLQPDAQLVTFLNVNVSAKGTFVGTVTLSLGSVPTGITATLTPTVYDLTTSPVQVGQLTFRTTTGRAAFGPTAVPLTVASGAPLAGTNVFIALQFVSAVDQGGEQVIRVLPRVVEMRPAQGSPGSYESVTILGAHLAQIREVLTDSRELTARLEPGGTDEQIQLTIFVRPEAAPGRHSLMLVGPNGSLPVAFDVVRRVREFEDTALRTRVSGARPGVVSRAPARRGRFAVAGEDDELPVQASRTNITGVVPSVLQPGQTVEAKILGSKLQNVDSLRVGGSGVTVQLLDSGDAEIRVRFTVDAAADAGSRLVTVQVEGKSFTTVVDVASAPATTVAATAPAVPAAVVRESEPDNRVAAEEPTPAESKSKVPASPDLAVSPDDFTMSPANPRPGDTVHFRVRVTNAGTQPAENATVEFTIGGLNIRVREQVSLEPRASQTFDFEWQATKAGRIEPRVAVDPEKLIPEFDRGNNVAALAAFDLGGGSAAARGSSGSGPGPGVIRERAQLSLPPGTCAAFRFGAGTEQSCGGSGDLELHVAADGGSIRLEADGIRSLGFASLDQYSTAPGGSFQRTENLQAGSTYVVETRSGAVLVRVAEVRGLGSARNAPPAPLRRPGAEGLGMEGRVSPMMRNITVVFEWKVLQRP